MRIGRENNVVMWRESTQTAVTMLYGMTGIFFTTNTRYVHPIPREQDYIPDMPDAEEGEDPLPPFTVALTNKLREGAFEGRRKAVEKQKSDERTIWPFMWSRMSPASQSKVKEDPDFEDAYLNLDCVRLWGFIRRTHLTHIFGDGDPLREINIQEQESRYSNLKQEEREYIATFKARFDNQLKAGEGAGVAVTTDSKKAMEFLGKLDQRRYGAMTARMRNDALRGVENAYPTTLAEAYRIASNWITDQPGHTSKGLYRGQENAVFLADTVMAARCEQPQQQLKSTNYVNRSSPSGMCYVCGGQHRAKECPRKFISETAKITRNEEWNPVYLSRSKNETAMYTKYDVLLDNEASLNIFSNRNLLRDVRRSARTIVMTEVEANSAGTVVDTEGTFEDVGHVYYSEHANANILSFATQVDNGADISYDNKQDLFTMRPANSKQVYTFARKNTAGSDSRLYSCDIRTMITRDSAMLTTVESIMTAYTQREVSAAKKARELPARMSFPSVADAKHLVTTSSGFDVTARDFDIANDIYGQDVASIKGKSVKPVGFKVDMSDSTSGSHDQQTLSIDIMFIDKIPTLIGDASYHGVWAEELRGFQAFQISSDNPTWHRTVPGSSESKQL